MEPNHLIGLGIQQLCMSIQCISLEDGMVMTLWMIFINTVLVSSKVSWINWIIASNYWYELKRIKGIRPSPRYRHTAVVANNTMIIFGGVDTEQKRFNDLFSYEFDKRTWTTVSVSGNQP